MLYAPRWWSRFATLLLVVSVLMVSSVTWRAQDGATVPLPLPTAVDDVITPEPILPTPNPESTADPEPPIEEPVEIEPTATPEILPPPESTAEPTPEIEPEDEPTPELIAPVEALVYEADKLDGALTLVLEHLSVGDIDSAFDVTRDYFIPLDGQGRVRLQIWANPDTDMNALTVLIESNGGRVESVDGRSVYARVSFEGIAQLSVDPLVSVVLLQSQIASNPDIALRLTHALGSATRAPVGNTYTEGYEFAGVEAWHNAGYRGGTGGDRVRIALIDIGFGTSTGVNNNLSCYRSASVSFVYPAGGTPQAGDSPRGRRMAEVICDLAPESNVRFYKVSTPQDLFNAVQLARTDNRIIVIGVDLGAHTSPGDGTLGYASANDPYLAIQQAVNSGVAVIASAGNNGTAYKTFSYNGGSASLTIQVPPGGNINMSWSDWDTAPAEGGAREDFSVSLSGAGFATLNKPVRGSGNPGHQFAVPGSCTASGGLCTVTLTLGAFTSGNAASVAVQVQATGTGANVGTPTGAGATPATTSGTLARPADSGDVVTVGAVCAQPLLNYPAMGYSSQGPIFVTGGQIPPTPVNPFRTRGETKPDLVSSAQVSVGDVFASSGDCSSGFGGSEAATAHVAGMAAVLLSNNNINAFKTTNMPNTLRNYLQARAFEMPLGSSANGFDTQFGAGFAVLGSPFFNVDTANALQSYPVPDRLPAGECTGGIVYAGAQNIGAPDMDGTITKPFTQLAHAITVASQSANRCVIALPGEYNAPLLFDDNFVNPVSVYGYASVSSFIVGDSFLSLQNGYTDGSTLDNLTAGVYMLGASGHTLGGFTFQQGTDFGSDVLGRANVSAVIFHNTSDSYLTNNRFSNFVAVSDVSMIQVVEGSTGIEITDNAFTGNASDTGGLTLINISDSGNAGYADRIRIQNNVIDNNSSITGAQFIRNVRAQDNVLTTASVGWRPLVRTVNSHTDIVNNSFTNNQFETVISAITRLRVEPYVTRIYGNVFVSNTSATVDAVSAPGPLVHLFNMQQIQFVNNTVGNNDLTASAGAFGTMIGRGDDIEGNYIDNAFEPSYSGSLIQTQARWDIHNNFVFYNLFPRGIVSDFDSLVTAQCRSYLEPGTDHTGLKHNFISRSGNNYVNLYGVCGVSAATPANNNIVLVDPYPMDEDGVFIEGSDTYILGGDDKTLPGFYSLTGYEPAVPPSSAGTKAQDGVDEGSEALITALGFPEFIAVGAVDARGMARKNDGDAFDVPNIDTIDMGAYELTPLTINLPANFAFNEDSGVFTFDLLDYVDGGFPPYSVNVTRAPDYYGTHCDSRFVPQVRGLVVNSFSNNAVFASYCAPQHFHTDTSHPNFTPSGAGFDLTLRDGSNKTVSGTVRYVVNPINDSPLNTVIDTTRSIGLGRVDNVRLRPYVDFSENFVFVGTNNETDYDFTYSLPVLVADAGNNNTSVLTSNLSWNSSVQGIISFDLSAVATPAQGRFSYQVTDRNGNSVTNFITIRAVVPPAPFNQLTPALGSVVAGTSALEGFVWQAAANATSYDLSLIYAGVVNTPVLSLTGLTPASDGDRLTCDASICTYSLAEGETAGLASGTYRWTVTALNDGAETIASNAPVSFTLSLAEELLINGGFEFAGANKNLAQGWKLNNATNDKRVCDKPDKDKYFAYEGACAFRLRGGVGKRVALKQKVPVTGRVGDTLTFSGYLFGRNSVGGDVSLIVKYKGGTKDVLQLNVPGGSYDYFYFSQSTTISGDLKNLVVRARARGGGGQFIMDSLSLQIEREQAFNLILPLRNTVYVDPQAVRNFTWQTSANVKTYEFLLVERSSGVVEILNLGGLTAAADGDPLTCQNGVCRFDLAAAGITSLPGGDYEWSVTAANGFSPRNGPFSFVIDGSAQELLVNGTFEGTVNARKQPNGWKGNNALRAEVKCDKLNKDKYFSYQGACAYQINGTKPLANPTKLVQNMSFAGIVSPGDTLTLRVFAAGKNLRPELARLQFDVNYTDGTRDRVVLRLPGGTYDYADFSESLTVNPGKTIKNIKLQVRYTGDRGWVRLDNVSVSR